MERVDVDNDKVLDALLFSKDSIPQVEVSDKNDDMVMETVTYFSTWSSHPSNIDKTYSLEYNLPDINGNPSGVTLNDLLVQYQTLMNSPKHADEFDERFEEYDAAGFLKRYSLRRNSELVVQMWTDMNEFMDEILIIHPEKQYKYHISLNIRIQTSWSPRRISSADIQLAPSPGSEYILKRTVKE